MKNFIFFIFCTTSVLVQLSIEGSFFSSGRIPDLALALVITLVLSMGFEKSVGWLVFMGLLIDAGSGTIFGTAALTYVFVGWAISHLASVADIRSRKILFAASLGTITVFSEIAKDLFFWASFRFKDYYLHQPFGIHANFFSLDYFFKMLYTVLAVYLIYYVFRRSSRRLLNTPMKLARKRRF
ncbi:MAG: rod shape-determining protein MreD [Candidatus Moranbacteria bacterium]|nr:rod shape-determining protein MreD [Candidatus Moranbacteria bacterium]